MTLAGVGAVMLENPVERKVSPVLVVVMLGTLVEEIVMLRSLVVRDVMRKYTVASTVVLLSELLGSFLLALLTLPYWTR